MPLDEARKAGVVAPVTPPEESAPAEETAASSVTSTPTSEVPSSEATAKAAPAVSSKSDQPAAASTSSAPSTPVKTEAKVHKKRQRCVSQYLQSFYICLQCFSPVCSARSRLRSRVYSAMIKSSHLPSNTSSQYPSSSPAFLALGLSRVSPFSSIDHFVLDLP